MRDTGLTAADAWALADDRSTWRALRSTAGYAQQWVSWIRQWGEQLPSQRSTVCRPVTTVGSRQRLRSATRGDLVVCSSVTHFGTRTFAVAGPQAWNQLPVHIQARETVSLFKTALKTHLHFVELSPNCPGTPARRCNDCIMLRRIRNCRRYYYYCF